MNSEELSDSEVAKNDESPPGDFCDVSIGVLTALPEEYAACKLVFDPSLSGVELYKRATSGQLRCWICRIEAKNGGHHTVAITLLSDMGNNAAAIAANILFQHCEMFHRQVRLFGSVTSGALGFGVG